MHETEFTQLMRRVREGSQDAARELVHRFGPHVLRVVRRRLHQALRSKFDPCDFEQEVWAAFFAMPPDRYMFDRPEQLNWFLAALANNKVVEAVRQRFLTKKFNVNRERGLTWIGTLPRSRPGSRRRPRSPWHGKSGSCS